MHQGVLRDDARRLAKQREREEALEASREKQRAYERVQKVGEPQGQQRRPKPLDFECCAREQGMAPLDVTSHFLIGDRELSSRHR